MNVFAAQPELDQNFPKITNLWLDPITKLSVPKDSTKNLIWRSQLFDEAEKDVELQADLYTAASQSILFFINTFCFTLRVFESEGGILQQARNKHLPYVTWDIQNGHILKLEHAIDEGESRLTDKSRDMGATWDHIAVYVHRFLFRADESHLMISRKEDAVDNLSGLPKNYPFGPLADPGTLFGKVDYVLSRLPEWMLPRISRKKLHVINLDNRTRIDGESANSTAGSSDRRTSIFLDEFAKVDEAEAIKRSTRDVSACRLVCSTPNGAGTTFTKWRLSGTIPVSVMPWWEHPEKGAGRYCKQDDLGRWRIRSPWYDAECEARSPKEVATELDMDHVGSGDMFFEPDKIEKHKKLFARPPKRKMVINFRKGTPDDYIPTLLQKLEVERVAYNTWAAGPWKIWIELLKSRPDQAYTYTLGIDIGKGQGASNSVISILCNETREKIAEFCDANTPPHALARIAVAAALWCGGRNKRPLIVWENNGDPGFDFGNQITREYQYSNCFFDRQAGTLRQKVGKRWGWRSSREKKATALGILRRAYAHDKFINHSVEALDECLTYVQYEGGGIGPAELLYESEANRESHGDRVIADMLILVGLLESRKMLKGDGIIIPHRSFGQRLKTFKQGRQADQSKKSFNFNEAA